MQLPSIASPGGDHGHSHAVEKAKAGPNGGRLIQAVSPNAEFFVMEDRTAQITFVDAAGKVVAPEGQVVSLIGGERSAPITVAFEAVDGVLRSTQALPQQHNMPIILSIKPTAEASTHRERFYLNQSVCSGCDLEEYACTCGH